MFNSCVFGDLCDLFGILEVWVGKRKLRKHRRVLHLKFCFFIRVIYIKMKMVYSIIHFKITKLLNGDNVGQNSLKYFYTASHYS